MSRMDRLPGTKPGRRVRNVAVGIGYLLAVPIVVALLPLLAVVAVSANYRNSATRLSRLPGVDPAGGVRAAFVAGMYVFVLWGVVLMVGNVAVDTAIDSEPRDTRAGPGDERVEDESTASEEELLLVFETTAQQHGVEVTSVELSDGVLAVEYRVGATTEDELTDEMAFLIGPYVDVVDEGLETDRMEVTMLDPDTDDERAYWRVDAEWADAYNAGELTENEVFDRVFETFERADSE